MTGTLIEFPGGSVCRDRQWTLLLKYHSAEAWTRQFGAPQSIVNAKSLRLQMNEKLTFGYAHK